MSQPRAFGRHNQLFACRDGSRKMDRRLPQHLGIYIQMVRLLHLARNGTDTEGTAMILLSSPVRLFEWIISYWFIRRRSMPLAAYPPVLAQPIDFQFPPDGS